MLQLFHLVKASGGRVILSGDTRQHGAVEASDALRVIEKHSGIRTIELTTIRRQDPALGRSREERRRIEQYRQAVKEAQSGKFADSFRRLDELGAIVSNCRRETNRFAWPRVTSRMLKLANRQLSFRKRGPKLAGSMNRCGRV